MGNKDKERQAGDSYRAKAPLADRMRPRSMDEFLGQEHLMGKGRAFRQTVELDQITSLIFWGPPGTGKTTLARLIALETGRQFIHLSAVSAGVKDIKETVKAAKDLILLKDCGTILFLDEIHRFNKAQQDALLPHVEDGTLTLIGATTENPSFEVISALLSRCKVAVLNHLGDKDLETVLMRALDDSDRGLGKLHLNVDKNAMELLVSLAMGDARVLLNNLELAALRASHCKDAFITKTHIEDATGKKALMYDKGGEEHFNLISALHKSLRGSDPQASVYYLMRMLKAGEDPLYIARRMARFASEDVGCADPNALTLAMAAVDAVRFLGLPECDAAMAEVAVYLATAPKSNALYKAVQEASSAIESSGHLPVPKKIRNAPTKLMKDHGYGAGYRYPDNFEEGYVPEDYLPDEIAGKVFYKPSKFGFEKEIEKRIDYWNSLRKPDKD